MKRIFFILAMTIVSILAKSQVVQNPLIDTTINSIHYQEKNFLGLTLFLYYVQKI